MLNYFLILLLSHLLTDFVFQTDGMVKSKNDSDIKAHKALLLHAGIFFITSLSLFFIFLRVQWFSWFHLLIILLISFTHYIVDLLKGKLINCTFSDKSGVEQSKQNNFEYPNWLFWAY